MSQELLNVKYDVFKQQPTNEKLNTLFVKIEDLRECWENRFKAVSTAGRWNKAYAMLGGGAAAFVLIVGKIGISLLGGGK